MPDLSDFIALIRRHRELGYSRGASIRLALWCINPEAGLFPEHTQEKT